MPERFCGGDSLRSGAISSVCTFTFYLYLSTLGDRKGISALVQLSEVLLWEIFGGPGLTWNDLQKIGWLNGNRKWYSSLVEVVVAVVIVVAVVVLIHLSID